jgi:hypothetical protein
MAKTDVKAWLQENTALQQKILSTVNGADFEVLGVVAVMHSFAQVAIRCTINEVKQTYYLSNLNIKEHASIRRPRCILYAAFA